MHTMSDSKKSDEDWAEPDSQARISDNRAIMRRLRKYYESVQEDEIPDRFLDLVDKLERAESKPKGSTDK